MFRAVRSTIILLAIIALAPRLAAAEDRDPATFAPADAAIYIGVTDFAQALDALMATATIRATEDPDFVQAGESNPFLGELEQFKKSLAKTLNVAPEELKNPFGGPAAFFMMLPAEANQQPQGVLIASVKNHERLERYYKEAIKKLRAAEGRYESDSYRGETIDSFEAEDKQGAGDKELPLDDFDDFNPNDEDSLKPKVLDLLSGENVPDKIAACLTEDYLLVADTADQLKQALRRMDSSGSDTLAEQRGLRDGLRKLDSGQVQIMVNWQPILARQMKEQGETLRGLGLDGLRQLVGTVQIGGDFEFRYDAIQFMQGDRSGLLKLMTPPNEPLEPPAGITADTVLYAGANINLGELVEEIIKLTRALSPEMGAEMDADFGKFELPDGETIDLRKQFLRHMRAPLEFAAGFTRPYDASSARLVVRVNQVNPTEVGDVLSKIPGMVERDLRGSRVFDMALGGVTAAVDSSRMFVGNRAEVERSLTAGDERGLKRDESFKKLVGLMPDKAWLLVYADSRRMMEALAGLLPERQTLETAMMTDIGAAFTTGMLYNTFGDQTDAAKARKMIQYSAASMFTLSTTPDGLHLRAVQLKPEE